MFANKRISILFEVGSIDKELHNGNFEVLQDTHISEVWDLLRRQCVLSSNTLDFNLNISHCAWKIAGANVGGIKRNMDKKPFLGKDKVHSSSNAIIVNGNIDNSLSDTALKTWVMTYLLS